MSGFLADHRPSPLGVALFFSASIHLLIFFQINSQGVFWESGHHLDVLQVRVIKKPLQPKQLKMSAEIDRSLDSPPKKFEDSPVTQANLPIPPQNEMRFDKSQAEVGTTQIADVVVNVETGVPMSEESRTISTEVAQSVHFRLKINPAGFVDDWSIESVPVEPFIEYPELLNNLVSNMQFKRTGETYFVEWWGFVEKKENVWIGKLKRIEHADAGSQQGVQ